MVKILQQYIELSKPTINIHVQVKTMDIDMKVESLEHLNNILKYRHEELKENITGTLIIGKNDNKGT